DAERPGHPLFAAKEVDDDWHVVAAHVLEEQRWPARLDDAVGDLGDFELGGDGRGDALKLALLLQKRHEVAQILKRHAVPLPLRDGARHAFVAWNIPRPS